MTATVLETRTAKGNVTALMVALLAACVAFQLNASMLSPASEQTIIRSMKSGKPLRYSTILAWIIRPRTKPGAK